MSSVISVSQVFIDLGNDHQNHVCCLSCSKEYPREYPKLSGASLSREDSKPGCSLEASVLLPIRDSTTENDGRKGFE